MFAYGLCIGPSDKYEKFASPSLRRFAADAPVLERRGQSSIFSAYNSIIDEVLSLPNPVEGLVLMHEDVEFKEAVERTLRDEFADPDVAIVGAIGGRGVRSVRWSKAEQTFGRAPDTFYGANDHGGGSHSVDTVDGLFLALSPWAIANLRFDEQLFTGFHGYDADICMQAIQAGKQVRVADFELLHHTKGGFGDVRTHRLVDDIFRKKWGVPLDSIAHRMRAKLRNSAY